MNHPDNTPTAVTIAPTASALDTAIAQALVQYQQDEAALAANAAAVRQQAEQQAINRFRLPFDTATTAVLPTLGFRFELLVLLLLKVI